MTTQLLTKNGKYGSIVDGKLSAQTRNYKKVVKAVPLSLVALSLAACGGSETVVTTGEVTTTTTTPTATPGSVFELIGNAGTVTFYNPGTAITLTESGSTLSFASTGGTMGDGTATISDALATTVSIPTGTTLTAAGSILDGKATSGTGDLVITGSSTAHDLSGIGHSGNITITGTAAAASLVAMDLDTDNKINALSVTSVSGSTADVKNALNDQLTIDTAADVTATITDADAVSILATDLSAIGGYTTGTVSVSNAIAISGTVAQVKAALVTDASKVTAGTSVVTLSDADGVSITITDLSGIGATTSGTVTVSNAIATSGTKAAITAAFVTDASKVVASKAAVTISTDTTITAADVEIFETAIGALNLGSAVTVTIAAGGDADFEATTVSGDTLTINGTGDNGGETLTITGVSGAQTIDLSNVTIDGDDITVVNIIGGAAVDTITASGGVDKITGAGGVDIITITDASKDDVVLASATADYDDITGFASGADADDLVTLDTVFGFLQGTTDGTILAAAGGDVDDAITAVANATLLNLDDDLTSDILDEIIAGTKTTAEVITDAIAVMADVTLLGDTEKVLVAIDDSEDTAIFWVQQDGTAGILAAEVTLLAVLQGVTADLVATDFIVA